MGAAAVAVAILTPSGALPAPTAGWCASKSLGETRKRREKFVSQTVLLLHTPAQLFQLFVFFFVFLLRIKSGADGT